jgi:hypothetical protein
VEKMGENGSDTKKRMTKDQQIIHDLGLDDVSAKGFDIILKQKRSESQHEEPERKPFLLC